MRRLGFNSYVRGACLFGGLVQLSLDMLSFFVHGCPEVIPSALRPSRCKRLRARVVADSTTYPMPSVSGPHY